ncbi:hypothetical protein [Singulisphaera sp. PoT]|uniref:hypothetical protein n=1 Tax=Singulisphaera sp. PoT TaxID=3411797 RepID=UPI003BF518B5
MPSKREEHGRQNGGAGRGVRETLRSHEDQVREGVEKAAQYGSEQWDHAREEAARRYSDAQDMVRRNPAPSVLVGLGVGFGLGLVLTTLLGRREETWAERNFPETYRGASNSFHHLADSVRNLPDAISRRIPSHFGRS